MMPNEARLVPGSSLRIVVLDKHLLFAAVVLAAVVVAAAAAAAAVFAADSRRHSLP